MATDPQKPSKFNPRKFKCIIRTPYSVPSSSTLCLQVLLILLLRTVGTSDTKCEFSEFYVHATCRASYTVVSMYVCMYVLYNYAHT